ncbi:MAG: hypothetical protein DME50_02685 [Verrucomicrobia bacterium]|nr:MAG: hypothetical protein DME50_02685 [Verrucomicrobiota bacterium]
MAALYGGAIPRFKRAFYQIAFHQGVFTSLYHVPTNGNRSRRIKLMAATDTKFFRLTCNHLVA